MSINSIFNLGIAFAASVGISCAMSACSDDSSSEAPSEDFGYEPSSSSISDRADVEYKDSIILDQKIDLNIELIKNTDERDSSEVYVDSSDRTIPLYIGELTQGSLIKVKASTANIEDAKIRIKNEHGEYLKALTAVARNKDHLDSTFGNFMSPNLGTIADSTYRDSNQFVVMVPNHYYLELEGNFTDESTARLNVHVDTSYFDYIGEGESVSMTMNDTLHGIIFVEGDSTESINVNFSANEGYSLNLTATGTNIKNYELLEKDSLLEDFLTDIDTMLIPNDSINWTLKVKFSKVWSGPFAFFNVTSRSRELGKGEYFNYPDSIKYPGEELESTRPKDLPEEGIYRYNKRQEQYVWLGDYKKNDTLMISHSIKNYSDDMFKNPVTYEILDKNKEVQGSISSSFGGKFIVPAEGPYYLHYVRLNSTPNDQVLDSLRYVLQLYTLVQQPGLLEDMKFYDDEMDDNVTHINMSAGDTLRFSRFSFNFFPNSQTSWKEIGSNVDWFIPCESLDYINRNGIYACMGDETEKQISSDYLTAQEAGIGSTATIIAQSKADPSMRASLKITIIKAAD